MPASRHQDHTTSPSAPVSAKAARRSWYQSRRSFSEGGSASLVLRCCRVHRIPCPTFVTTAKRPSFGHETRRILPVICPSEQRRKTAANWHDGQISRDAHNRVK